MGRSWLSLQGIHCKKVAWPLGALVVLLDQLSKLWVRAALPPGESTPPEGLLRITHVDNPGIMCGLGANIPGLFLLPAAAVVITSFIYWRYVPPRSRLLGVAIGLFVGGCLGNLIDRMALGSVTYFIDIEVSAGFGGLVLNLADLSCVAGLFAFSFFLIRLRFTMIPR